MNTYQPCPPAPKTPSSEVELATNAIDYMDISTFTLPCLANLTASSTEWKSPWLHAERPRITFDDKPAYKAYIENPNTESCLFSGVSGLSKFERVSRNNPPTRLHAIVTDYDSELDEAKRAWYLNSRTVKPTFLAQSYSGGTRAVWVLEKPLPILQDALFQHALLKQIAKDLNLGKAFGMLDETAFYNLSQVYHVGWEWRNGDGSPLPTSRTMLWFNAALAKAKLGDQYLSIPLDRVGAEVHRRFPGRWEGDFELGARGCRFWDAQADCPTAALVTEKGMVCFTGAFSFRSWRDIFGDEFVEEYKHDTLGAATRDSYFINNKFYLKVHMLTPAGDSMPSWQNYNRQNFESVLASSYGLKTRCDKDSGEQESQVKQAVGVIAQQKALSAAAPFIYNPNEVVKLGDNFYLNTSFLRVMKPDENASTEWGQDFPWIAEFLEKLFPDIIQRDRFICEWAYAYQNAFHMRPKNGRVAFIAGEPGVGKNFVTEVLIGPSMGGFTDASDYLLGVSRFNSQLFETGVWVLNDTVSREDRKERTHFTKMLKKMAANKNHVVEGKFKDAASIGWTGRIFVTLNTDPISLGLLPEIDLNNRDKISLYRTSTEPMTDRDAAQKAANELPAFCNYLLHLEFPEHCLGDSRWGVNGYLHPELLEEAESSGRSATFEEILNMYVEGVFASDKSLTEITSIGSDWFTRLSDDCQTSALMKHYNAQYVAIQLGILLKRGGYPIEFKKRNKGRFWTIKRQSWEQYMNSACEEYLDAQMPF